MKNGWVGLSHSTEHVAISIPLPSWRVFILAKLRGGNIITTLLDPFDAAQIGMSLIERASGVVKPEMTGSE